MKRSITLMLVLLLATVPLVGCGESSSGAGNGSGGEPAAAEGEESFEAFLQDSYSDTDWFAAIESITQVQKLRADVTEVHFAATAQQVRDDGYLDPVLNAASEWGSEVQQSVYVECYGTDGRAGGGGIGIDLQPLDLPPAPASVDEMAAWMESAYGPGSGDPVEEWYELITGYETRVDQYSGETVLRILTDIPYESGMGAGFELAELVRIAASTAGITWAQQVETVYADGNNVSHGEIEVFNPYEGY